MTHRAILLSRVPLAGARIDETVVASTMPDPHQETGSDEV
jgi:hypothetical protein